MTTKSYLVTVITGTKRFADTRAEVNITIQGTLGSSPETQLSGEFETGSSREFTFEFADLGSLTSVDLRQDDSGTAPAWFVDKVLVRDSTTGSTWVFPAGRWLSDTATHTLSGELLGSDVVVTPTLWQGWVWGQNDHGELGDGTNKRRFAPAPLPYLDQVGVSAIDGGGWFSLALLDDGSVWSWGMNDWAQLGDGANETRFAPVNVMHLKLCSVSKPLPRAAGSAWPCSRTGLYGAGVQTTGASSARATPGSPSTTSRSRSRVSAMSRPWMPAAGIRWHCAKMAPSGPGATTARVSLATAPTPTTAHRRSCLD